MLEEAEEREREFDAQKKQWNSGSFSYEKIQQYISDLEEERQNVGQLQEKCNGLEQKLNELESDNSSLQKKLFEMQTRHKSDSDEREVGEMSFLLLFVRAIFVWPWSENAQIKRFDWFIERIQTHLAFGWLSERSAEKTSCPKNFPEITLTSYYNTIGQSNNAFSILGFSLAGKRRVHVLFFSSIGWTNNKHSRKPFFKVIQKLLY